MSTTTDISQLYEVGNRRFFAAEILPNGTFGTKEYHEGLIEVNLEFTQEVTDINADDNPSFIQLAGAVSGEGSIQFAVLPLSVYTKFFNATRDRNNAVVISGRATPPKRVAFGFYSQLGDGSTSMFTIYNSSFSLPPLNTVSFDGETIRDLTLEVNIRPHTYRDAANREQQVSYTIINSNTNASIWDRVQDAIYIPDTEVA